MKKNIIEKFIAVLEFISDCMMYGLEVVGALACLVLPGVCLFVNTPPVEWWWSFMYIFTIQWAAYLIKDLYKKYKDSIHTKTSKA